MGEGWGRALAYVDAGKPMLRKCQERPETASEVGLWGRQGPLGLGTPDASLPQPVSHAGLEAGQQAAAPSSARPSGAATSICRVPSLVLNHSALLIGDD